MCHPIETFNKMSTQVDVDIDWQGAAAVYVMSRHVGRDMYITHRKAFRGVYKKKGPPLLLPPYTASEIVVCPRRVYIYLKRFPPGFDSRAFGPYIDNVSYTHPVGIPDLGIR